MMMQRSYPLLVGLGLAVAMTPACGGDDGAPQRVDDDGGDSSGSADASTTAGSTDPAEGSSTGFVPICMPGDVRCSDASDAIEVCAGTGLEWEVELQCGTYSTCRPCEDGDDQCSFPSCVGPCEQTENDPSSAGCAFVANRQLHPYEGFADGLVVTNPSEDLVAAVQVFEVPEGLLEESMLESFNLMPGESHTLELTTDFIPGVGSNLRTGGIFRVYSDVPVVAYQHSPLQANRGNESALLLPDRVLGNDYVVMSYNSLWTTVKGVSYFELVALQDDTRVEWTPSTNTQGNGLPIDPVEAGETGALTLNRYETIRIVPSQGQLKNPEEPAQYQTLDISGTVIHADKPVWVTGANRYAGVPFREDGGTADQIQETLFPLQHWGRDYVLPAAIRREWEETENKEWANYAEPTYYRVYAGSPEVTVESTPPHPDFPVTLENTGDFVEFETPAGEHLTLSANRPFMPVQYLRSRNAGSALSLPQTGHGDSAMVQMVPTEQYLSRYVFSTGIGFYYNSIQITRPVSQDEVRLILPSGETRDVCSTGCFYSFQAVGDYEVATLQNLPEGTYTAESDTPFGLIQSGHARGVGLDTNGDPIDTGCIDPPPGPSGGFCNSSYAYPGGMKAESIFIP